MLKWIKALYKCQGFKLPIQSTNQSIKSIIVYHSLLNSIIQLAYKAMNLSTESSGPISRRRFEMLRNNSPGTKAHHITIDALLQHSRIATSNLRAHQHVAWATKIYQHENHGKKTGEKTTGNWWKLDVTIFYIWLYSKLWGFKSHNEWYFGKNYLQ